MIAIPTDGAPIAEVILAGKHVRLEPLRESHFDQLLAAAMHESYPFTWVPQTREALRTWLDAAFADLQKGVAVPFATFDLKDGALVGATRFGNIEYWDWRGTRTPPRPPKNPDAVEIGWTWLAPRAQLTAINSEAKLLMLTHAFEIWKVSRVTLKTDARNFRSRNAIARIGGKLDGILRAHMPASDGGIRDTAFFSIVASEWPEVKAKLESGLARQACSQIRPEDKNK